MTPGDARFMRRALALARRGRRGASPNPMVGCVVVNAGRIVGEGWHMRFGGPHAEPLALKSAGLKAAGSTAYVTLEPCCHFGKTPPCADALIRAKVRRVVAAMRDPNPLVAGKGLEALRRAGISVSTGLLGAEARRLNRAFCSNIARSRPTVILKAAASLDGRIETSAKESKWITSPAARNLSRRMRAGVDAILVGVETVLADDPRLTAGRGKRDPIRVILDSRLRAPRRARVFSEPGRTIVASARRPGRRPRRAAIPWEWRGIAARGSAGRRNGGHPAGLRIELARRKDGLDLRALLRALSGQGIGTLLVEGGSAVHTAFLEAGLVDEVRIFIAPRLIGGGGARTFFEGRGFRRLSGALKLDSVSVRRVGEDILVTGKVRGR